MEFMSCERTAHRIDSDLKKLNSTFKCEIAAPHTKTDINNVDWWLTNEFRTIEIDFFLSEVENREDQQQVAMHSIQTIPHTQMIEACDSFFNVSKIN